MTDANVPTLDENDLLQAGALPSDPFADTTPMTDPALRESGFVPPKHIVDLARDGLARADARKRRDELPIPVPWPEYARLIGGGFWPGMHILVAGTGAGKTTWATQIAIEAAKQGFPVAYVGLELDEAQIGLRMVAEQASVGWSSLYLGTHSERTRTLAEQALEEMQPWPLFAEMGDPAGWPASKLQSLARFLSTKGSPGKPSLIVLDFLQLVGAEPGARDELRERIGKAAYRARQVARQHNAAILVVSSAARDKYGALASGAGDAGLILTSEVTGSRGIILQPDAIIGLGKESGEIEYAADSVTVLIKYPNEVEQPVVLCAVPKLRYGKPEWIAFNFEHQHFTFVPFDQMPLPSKKKARKGNGRNDNESDGDKLLADDETRGQNTVADRGPFSHDDF